MKHLISVGLLLLCICNLTFARNDENAVNNIGSIKEYLQRNIDTLNPIEGIYRVTLEFRINGKLCYESVPFDIFVDFEEKRNTKKSFIVSYIGYTDPFDGKSLPENEIREVPNACIMFCYIIQHDNTNLYNLPICPFGPKKAFCNQSFVLDLGAKDFIVEYDSITSDGYEYFGVPQKYINKKPEMVLKAKKIFPLI